MNRPKTPLVGAAKLVYIVVAVLSYAVLAVFYAYTSRIVSAIGATTSHAIVIGVGCVMTLGLLVLVARRVDRSAGRTKPINAHFISSPRTRRRRKRGH